MKTGKKNTESCIVKGTTISCKFDQKSNTWFCVFFLLTDNVSLIITPKEENWEKRKQKHRIMYLIFGQTSMIWNFDTQEFYSFWKTDNISLIISPCSEFH